MRTLVDYSAAKLSELLRSKEISSFELTRAFLERIEAAEPKLNAFLHLSPDLALEQARCVDYRRADSDGLAKLAGIPLAVKDNILTRSMPTTAASRILEGYRPPYDATVIRNLVGQGLVLLGKTNLDEFGMGSSTDYSAWGPTRNPWNLTKTPGGSGGGSAAALAARQAPLALGTDTGGSIRQPAHCTGTVGIKPTYGAVSRYGVIALASSLDQVGPCAGDVLDTALLHDAIVGYDPADSTSIPDAWPSMEAAARRGRSRGVAGLRFGLIKELCDGRYQPSIVESFRRLARALEQAGAEVLEVGAPSFEYAVAAYYLIMPAEASSNLARYDSVRFGLRAPAVPDTVESVMSTTRALGFGPEVIRRIILGTFALSSGYYDAYYLSAQRVRTLVVRDLARAFERADVLLSPAAPTTAFGLGEKVSDPMQMYLADLATIPANLAGIPAGVIPLGLMEDGLPAGVQILAPQRQDQRIYRAGAAIELLQAELGLGINQKPEGFF